MGVHGIDKGERNVRVRGGRRERKEVRNKRY